MSTREEIEAAERLARQQMYVKDCKHLWNAHRQCQWCHSMQRDVDVGIVSDAYLAERAERQRRIEAAAAEIAKTCAFWARGGATALCVDIITRHLDGKTT